MKPLQAPGVDGLHAQLFQSQWKIVGPSICKMIRNFFEGVAIDKALNKTTLVLIPKVDNPEVITEFRPINLCSVMYKVTTKIIVNRMTNLMKYVVSPNQVSFIKGRSITDNIIIAQECVHSMNNCKTKAGWMTIKVDLEKAYDKIRWEFVEDSLKDLELPQKIILIIME